MSKVEDFLKNGGYQVTKSGTNPFNNIEMEGTPRGLEEDNVGEIWKKKMLYTLKMRKKKIIVTKKTLKKTITVTKKILLAWTSRMFYSILY